MKIEFSSIVPSWLYWLVPSKIMEDLKRRARLNGKSSISFLRGQIVIDIETLKVLVPKSSIEKGQ